MRQTMHCKKSNVFHPLHFRETFKFVCMSVCQGKMSVSAYLFLCSPILSLFPCSSEFKCSFPMFHKTQDQGDMKRCTDDWNKNASLLTLKQNVHSPP